MQATSISRASRRDGPGNSRPFQGPQKSRVSGPIPSTGPRHGFAASKSLLPALYKKTGVLVIFST